MSDTLGWLCFSNAAFRWVKRTWFHPWVSWAIGTALIVGLPLALAGVVADRMGLVLAGLFLTLPFLLWVASLALVSLFLAVPRFMVLGLMLATVYFGWWRLGEKLNAWAAKYEKTASKSLQV